MHIKKNHSLEEEIKQWDRSAGGQPCINGQLNGCLPHAEWHLINPHSPMMWKHGLLPEEGNGEPWWSFLQGSDMIKIVCGKIALSAS